MIKTGFTDAQLEAAIRREPLLSDANKSPPKQAVDLVCAAMFTHSICDFDHTINEQEFWDRLPEGARLMELKNATWLIGLLHRGGFAIVNMEMLRRAVGA